VRHFEIQAALGGEVADELSQQNLSYILPGFYVDDGESNSRRLPIPQLGDRDVTSRLRIVETSAGIPFDEFRHCSDYTG